MNQPLKHLLHYPRHHIGLSHGIIMEAGYTGGFQLTALFDGPFHADTLYFFLVVGALNGL